MRNQITKDDARRKKKTMISMQIWGDCLIWGRGDSNPHALRHMILSHARLPVPALPQIQN